MQVIRVSIQGREMRLEYESQVVLRWANCFLCNELEQILKIWLIRPYLGSPNNWSITYEKLLVGLACGRCAHELSELGNSITNSIHVPYHIENNQLGRFIKVYKKKKEKELCGLRYNQKKSRYR